MVCSSSGRQSKSAKDLAISSRNRSRPFAILKAPTWLVYVGGKGGISHTMEVVVVLVLIFGLVIAPKLTMMLLQNLRAFSQRDTAPTLVKVEPKPRAPVKVPLGIPLARVSDRLSSPDTGRFVLHQVASQDYGTILYMGYSIGGGELVFTYGPPGNLDEVSSTILADMKYRESGLRVMDAVLSSVIPEWESGPSWVRDNLRPMQLLNSNTLATYGGKGIMIWYDTELGHPTYTLSVFGLTPVQED